MSPSDTGAEVNRGAPERLVRYLDYPDDADQPPIFNESLGGSARPDWLAVSHCPESASGPETFVLYFLTSEGGVLECIQRDTLEVALDEALSLTGLPHNCWIACDVPLHDQTTLHRGVIAGP